MSVKLSPRWPFNAVYFLNVGSSSWSATAEWLLPKVFLYYGYWTILSCGDQQALLCNPSIFTKYCQMVFNTLPLAALWKYKDGGCTTEVDYAAAPPEEVFMTFSGVSLLSWSLTADSGAVVISNSWLNCLQKRLEKKEICQVKLVRQPNTLDTLLFSLGQWFISLTLLFPFLNCSQMPSECTTFPIRYFCVIILSLSLSLYLYLSLVFYGLHMLLVFYLFMHLKGIYSLTWMAYYFYYLCINIRTL